MPERGHGGFVVAGVDGAAIGIQGVLADIAPMAPGAISTEVDALADAGNCGLRQLQAKVTVQIVGDEDAAFQGALTAQADQHEVIDIASVVLGL